MTYDIKQSEDGNWIVFNSENGKQIGEAFPLRRKAINRMQELRDADAKKAAESTDEIDDDSEDDKKKPKGKGKKAEDESDDEDDDDQ